MIILVGCLILTTNLKTKREVDVVVTTQAQKVLAATDYSVEEFVEWAISRNGFSLGGHNVMLFLESRGKD